VNLRDHPLMTRKSGYATWPPRWTTTRRDQNDKPLGEVGVLEEAMMNDLFDNKIFVFMNYQSSRYMGALHFDDRIFCCQIFTLLKSQVGRSIKDISDLDLSATL
jgi:hypothetical protein